MADPYAKLMKCHITINDIHVDGEVIEGHRRALNPLCTEGQMHVRPIEFCDLQWGLREHPRVGARLLLYLCGLNLLLRRLTGRFWSPWLAA